MTLEVIRIKTGYIRLDHALKLAGAGETGGQVKLLIQQGGAKVNGQTCLMRGKKLIPGDEATVNGITARIEKDED